MGVRENAFIAKMGSCENALLLIATERVNIDIIIKIIQL